MHFLSKRTVIWNSAPLLLGVTAVGGNLWAWLNLRWNKDESYWPGRNFAGSVGGVKFVLEPRRICMAVFDYNEMKLNASLDLHLVSEIVLSCVCG